MRAFASGASITTDLSQVPDGTAPLRVGGLNAMFMSEVQTTL
jgi:hypothetical protein